MSKNVSGIEKCERLQKSILEIGGWIDFAARKWYSRIEKCKKLQKSILERC